MKGVAWLASGLMLALLLVSAVSVGSQFSLAEVFSPVQNLASIGGQTGDRVTQQVNQLAAVSSTGDAVVNWLTPISDWLTGLWAQIVEAWKIFLGLISRPETVSSATREEIRQELLAELEGNGYCNIGNSTTTTTSNNVRYGIMVAPAGGSAARNAEIKKNLSQMFADQVDLRFDPNGMSGIVTPVFRDGRRGGDYVFVLTPLR